ncbi:MAG: hypothetical protein R2932_18725 [Caldilineaceae bacterium]
MLANCNVRFLSVTALNCVTKHLACFQNVFGNDAQAVDSRNPRKNACILVATYQTLDVDTADDSANFFLKHYPENYFSHIIVD